ncbi:glycosyltransferase [Amphritea sp. HPY]|uniref:glycosyltransferase n=1 Tax=Amphritea sp. HPY TaxID=3421652 RepID=UPI003D7DC165
MKKVLHLTEAFGGGVQTALISYVASSKGLEVEHSLVARSRSADDTGESYSGLFNRVDICSGSLLDFISMAKQAFCDIKPDVVHLHSSIAGFIFRFFNFGDAKLIYTPHCYAFERQDIGSAFSFVYRNLERFMISRIDVVAGCSQRECQLAEELGARETTYLNNYAVHEPDAVEEPPHPLNVVTVGRVSPQKDPAYIATVLEHLKKLRADQDVHFTWVGGGDPELEQQLRSVGVEVTGMLSRDRVMEILANADLYLHTAAWEGMPLTLLEAAKLDRPILCRSIGATAELPQVVTTAQDMALKIAAFGKGDMDVIRPCAELTRYINSFFTRKRQKKTLQQLYGQ